MSDRERIANDLSARRLYHGTRVGLSPGDLIEPHGASTSSARNEPAGNVYLTADPDAAIWEAELATGDGPARIYLVEPTGAIDDASDATRAPGHPSMDLRSRAPLRVIGEVTEWPLYHGTRVDLRRGDLIKPGHTSNFGKRTTANYVYMTRTLDAAIWGTELAAGDGRGRIYIVEPTGPIEDDPNLKDQKFRGNPTKSFRSRDPLRVVGEIAEWTPHAPEAVKAMKDGLERFKQLGVEHLD